MQGLESGALTEEAALEAFEISAVHVSQVDVSLKTELIPSGFRGFDHFELLKKGQGELVIVGARPSMGKSALMFQIGAFVARTGNVLIYSLEMDRKSIIKRMVAAKCGKAIKHLSSISAQTYQAARKEIDALSLYIDDRGGLDIKTIQSTALDFHRRKPLSLIVVDYLGLVKAREMGNKNNELGEVTGGLKALAKAIGCPILTGSQLNRECERRGKDQRSGNFGDFRPILADLRDSGNIEQDADIVVFLSRQEVYDGTRPGTADIRIAKNRNGEVADFGMNFSGKITMFSDDSRQFEEV